MAVYRENGGQIMLGKDSEIIQSVKRGLGIGDSIGSSFLTVRTLLKWLIISTVVGLIVGTVSSLFGHALVFVNDLRAKYPMLIFGLPFGGLLIVFLYRFFRNTEDKGTNTVISSIQTSREIPFRMAPLIFVSTVITHLFGGSAGREGAALQLGGSIANKLGKVLRLDENDHRTIIMCGMSAGFSALFGTPMAAAIFSLEVTSVGVMHYSALVPCVTASVVGHLVAQFFRIPPETFPVAGLPDLTAYNFLKIVVFAGVVGGLCIVFCNVLHLADHLYKKFLKRPYLRIFVGGCIIVGLTVLLGTDEYLGSGMGIIEDIFHTGRTEWYTFLLKMLFTALTIGAGFKGGEIVPSFCVGAAFGCFCAPLMGLPTDLVTACGMIGLFCGTTNCPVTSLLIAFELFGFEGAPYYLTTVAVSYMLSSYQSLYHEQKILFSKTQTHYVDTEEHHKFLQEMGED